MANDAGGLLDTSTLIWLVGDPNRIPSATREWIERVPIYVSVVSYWEVVTKAGMGKLNISDPVAWWHRAVAQAAASVLPITEQHVATLHSLPWLHRDPFDRMLTAQAIAGHYSLVTGDCMISEYPVTIVW